MNRTTKIVIAMILAIACMFCLAACIVVKKPNHESEKPSIISPSIRLGFKEDKAGEVYSETKLQFKKGEKALGNLSINAEAKDNLDKKYVVEIRVKNSTKSSFTMSGGADSANISHDIVNDTLIITLRPLKGSGFDTDHLVQFYFFDNVEIRVDIKDFSGKVIESKTQVVKYN